jgi:hypothetical protein
MRQDMRRTILTILGLLAVVGGAPSAWGVVFDHTAHYIKRGYHRNVDWPWPYVCPDRAAVRQPFGIMVENGWRRQNLLGDHHFNPNGSGLTTAGELKVRWIATQAPSAHRNIFVERSIDPSVTADRLATAREYAAIVAIDGQAPQVYETNLVSEGRPASVVDAINVRFQESAPAPVLPAATVDVTGQ